MEKKKMQVIPARAFMGRIRGKEDLLSAIKNICEKENIRTGVFSVIGALIRSRISYYKQLQKKYSEGFELNENLEIVSCGGNISMKSSEISVHAHITLANSEGKCFGGHLMPGSIVFAAEYYIQEFEGVSFERKPDQETGLDLWDNKDE